MSGNGPQRTYVLRMRAVASLPQEIESLADHVLSGRQTAARNEALRQVARRLQHIDTRARTDQAIVALPGQAEKRKGPEWSRPFCASN
jgi:hypothetical protein